MEAIRKVYKHLPDVLKMPKELQQRRVEVILLPLDDEVSSPSATDSRLARFAGAWDGEPVVREEQGEYEGCGRERSEN